MPESNENCTDVQIMTEKRKSIRVYQRKYLTKVHEAKLNEILRDVNNSIDDKRVRVIYVKEEFQRLCNITDCLQFLVGIIPKDLSDEHVIIVGRKLQEICIRLCKDGISTCCIGGFRGKEVQKSIKGFDKKNDHVALIVAVGYESYYIPYFVKFSMQSSLIRYPNEKLFFENKFGNPLDISKLNSKLQIVYKCARRSPSASNYQNVRIIKIGTNNFHFFKTGISQYYSILNVGIQMTNWLLACKELGINGKFLKRNPNLDIPKDVRYFWTWVQE